MIDVAKIVDSYPISHKKDIWNPPPWVFFPRLNLTLSPHQAGKRLGMSANTLKKHTDAFGLTVYRDPLTKARIYDRAEIEEIEKAMDEGRIKDIVIANGYGETEGKRRAGRRRAV